MNLSSAQPKPAEPIRPGALRLVAVYSIVLMVLFNLAAAGLIGTPITFLLKDKVSSVQLSLFGFFGDAPYFVGFLFGFLRDRWRPGGRGDRGYFVLAPFLMVLACLWVAYTPHTYANLVAGLVMFAATAALLGAAAQGLLAAVAKDFGMTGRLAVVALVTARGGMMWATTVASRFGQDVRLAAFASAAVGLTVILFAFWHPRAIFRSKDEVFVNVIPENAWAAASRLLRHKAVYLPALAIFFFEFAPGWGTPLLKFLTDHRGLTEGQFGDAQGWLRIGQIMAALSYSILCTKFRLKPLLYWGTFLAVVGGPAFLLIHNAGQANGVSFFAGICCGVALASYYDLLVRSCPKELEGVAFMLFASMLTLAADTSDLLGAWLYDRGGFALALGISTAVTALIFIPVFLVPHSVADPQEGERIVDRDPPVPEYGLAPEPA
jgi:MFS family permease